MNHNFNAIKLSTPPLVRLTETESVIPVHDLQNPTHTGPWTISHPVYTQEVSCFNTGSILILSDSVV